MCIPCVINYRYARPVVEKEPVKRFNGRSVILASTKAEKKHIRGKRKSRLRAEVEQGIGTASG